MEWKSNHADRQRGKQIVYDGILSYLMSWIMFLDFLKWNVQCRMRKRRNGSTDLVDSEIYLFAVFDLV